MTDDTWHLVKSTPKVTGFVGGTANKPTPISQKEVDAILHQMQEGVEKPRPKVLFEVGEAVRVKEGPFTDFHGNVEDVNYEKSKLRVSVTIFGRSTPVELDFGRSRRRRRSVTRGVKSGVTVEDGAVRNGEGASSVRLHPQGESQWQRKSSASSSCKCRRARRIPARRSAPRSASAASTSWNSARRSTRRRRRWSRACRCPVVITAYADKSFTFIMKTPPATVLIKKAAKVDKGSPKPHTDKVGKLTRAQAEEIAKTKMPDLTAADLDAAVRTIAGSARSMGITVEGVK